MTGKLQAQAKMGALLSIFVGVIALPIGRFGKFNPLARAASDAAAQRELAAAFGYDSDDSEDDDILQFVQHTVERHVRRRAAAKRLRRKRKLDWRRRKYLARGWEVPDAALTPLSRARSPSHSDRGPGRGQASPFVRKERSTMF